MVDDDIKTKNSIMEIFYECVSKKLHDIEDYQSAKLLLTTIFSPSEFAIYSTTESTHILVNFDNQEHDFIQLYNGDKDNYYFSVSPPSEEGDIIGQITTVQRLMLRL